MQAGIRGFSLIELAMATTILILATGLGMSFLSRSLDLWQLQGAAQALGAELTRLRGVAVSTGTPIRFVIRATADGYGPAIGPTDPSNWTVLPARIGFAAFPSRPVTFYSRGQAAPAGTFVLQSRAGTIRVVVAPMGRVRWEWDR